MHEVMGVSGICGEGEDCPSPKGEFRSPRSKCPARP